MFERLYISMRMVCMAIVMFFCAVLSVTAQQHFSLVSNTSDGAELPYYIKSWHPRLFVNCAVVDANNDGATWGLIEPVESLYSMRYLYNKYQAANDYIYLPPIHLLPGKSYEAKVYMHAGSDKYSETFSLGIIQDLDTAARVPLLSDQLVTAKESLPYKTRFVVATDTVYRLYVHCSSPANHYMLYIDSLSVVECGDGVMPHEVSGMTLTTNERTPHIVSIQCNAPTQSVDGEYLESLDSVVVYRNDELLYTFEQPSVGVELLYNDTVDIIGKYTYKVVAYNNAIAGNEAVETVVAGVAPYPYAHNFANGIGFFTIRDNNADDVTWHHYNDRLGGCMRYVSSAENAADDWLITPPIYLDGAVRYQVEYNCCVGLSHYPESMRVMLGLVPQPQEMSVLVSELDHFTFINDSVIVAPFYAQVPGIYYLAFKACSEADTYAILLRDVAINEYDPLSVAHAEMSPCDVRGGYGCVAIEVQEPQEVRIYNLLGAMVSTFTATATEQHPIATGVYIVKVGNVVRRVVVR